MAKMNYLIIEAAALFRDMLRENCIEEFIDLSNFQICYVKDMPHSHRSYWTQSDLILFGDIEGYSFTVSDLNGQRRGFYLYQDMPELTEVAFRKCLGVPFQKE